MKSEESRRLMLIRERAADRRATGQVGGVRDWFDIQFLLDLLDSRLCKNCKKELESE